MIFSTGTGKTDSIYPLPAEPDFLRHINDIPGKQPDLQVFRVFQVIDKPFAIAVQLHAAGAAEGRSTTDGINRITQCHVSKKMNRSRAFDKSTHSHVT